MYKLVIDIGNSRIKLGYFNPLGELECVEIIENFENYNFKFDVSSCLVSDVRNVLLPEFSFKTLKMSHHLKTHFVNLYGSKETLGTDRISNLEGASILHSNNNNLIVSFGTCITIDFLSNKNEFKGGNISPGLTMRFKSMNEMTGKLPQSNIGFYAPLLGNNTKEALANGAIIGIINEINGYINELKTKHNELNIIFCGGDSNYFVKQFNYKIFAVPNLALYGMYNILLLNED